MRRDAPRPARTPGTTDHPIGSDDVLPYPRPREGLPPVTDAPRALAAAVGPTIQRYMTGDLTC